MEKSFTIKALDSSNPEYVAASFGRRAGMGKFKDWELWEIRSIKNFGNIDRHDYYLAVKDNICIAGMVFTEILEYVDKHEKTVYNN